MTLPAGLLWTTYMQHNRSGCNWSDFKGQFIWNDSWAPCPLLHTAQTQGCLQWWEARLGRFFQCGSDVCGLLTLIPMFCKKLSMCLNSGSQRFNDLKCTLSAKWSRGQQHLSFIVNIKNWEIRNNWINKEVEQPGIFGYLKALAQTTRTSDVCAKEVKGPRRKY